MIASSVTCRVLQAIWLWLAALGQAAGSLLPSAAAGAHPERTVPSPGGSVRVPLARAIRVCRRRKRTCRRTRLRAAIESSLLYRIYRAVLRCGQDWPPVAGSSPAA